jgi:hypothetical protein
MIPLSKGVSFRRKTHSKTILSLIIQLPFEFYPALINSMKEETFDNTDEFLEI